MTIAQFKSAIAGYLSCAVADLTVNGVDLGLLALNQSRRKAELEYDFEFSRRLVTLSVDGSTGGDLDDVVLYGTSTSVDIKTVLDVGLFDEDNNLRPIFWDTVAAGLESQRQDNPRAGARYPTDQQIPRSPLGRTRFQFINDKVYRFPKDTSGADPVTLGLEVYIFCSDFVTTVPGVATVSGSITPNITGTYNFVGYLNNKPYYVKTDLAVIASLYNITDDNDGWALTYSDAGWVISAPSASGAGTYVADAGTAVGTATVTLTDLDDSLTSIWLTYGEQYLLWQSIVHLNHLEKNFVFRQEGNLPPPQTLADSGLAALREWDTMKFEQFRRHSR